MDYALPGLNEAHEGVSPCEEPVGLFVYKTLPLEPLQGLAGIWRTEPCLAVSMFKLQGLDKEFHIDNAALAGLDIIPLRVFLGNFSFHALSYAEHLFDIRRGKGLLIERLPELSHKYRAECEIPCHCARPGQGLPLPYKGLARMVIEERLLRYDQRARAARSPQASGPVGDQALPG